MQSVEYHFKTIKRDYKGLIAKALKSKLIQLYLAAAIIATIYFSQNNLHFPLTVLNLIPVLALLLLMILPLLAILILLVCLDRHSKILPDRLFINETGICIEWPDCKRTMKWQAYREIKETQHSLMFRGKKGIGPTILSRTGLSNDELKIAYEIFKNSGVPFKKYQKKQQRSIEGLPNV